MKLPLDQDVYAVTARLLNDLGHDVVPVARIGLSQAEDMEILRVAQEQSRILVTRDRDFGNPVFVQALGAGVLDPRILPSTQNAIHDQPERVLSIYRGRARRSICGHWCNWTQDSTLPRE